MKLTARLLTIANLVDKGHIVADIGTDHGYIPVYLIENNISSHVIGSDISIGPLNNAKKYIDKKNLKNRIKLRLTPGLEGFNDGEVDTVIIAGMGGNTIVEILENSKDIVKNVRSFIIQPMVGISEIRKYLYENNYKIVREKVVKEGNKYYQVLKVEKGCEKLIVEDIFFELSEKLIEEKDIFLKEFLEFKVKKIGKILENIESNGSKESKFKKHKFIRDRKKLLELIENVD